MKTNDYVKFMTQTMVQYMDLPREERKKRKQERKEAKAAFWYRWFGILPYVLYSEMKNRNEMKKRT
ncbi:MAG: YqzE family protein [Bacillota bacterium]|nr:YqzE family protein [Bacillota bacterium]MDP4169914.1 YqzE family protein [Bacillota bacterium]